MKLRYPVYIVSKGRWELRPTSKILERMCIPYRIVVEPQEYDRYASVIDSNKILVLPEGNLGQGSIPARNLAWEHSVSAGHARHWVLDDNISMFLRLNRNKKSLCLSPAIFCATEDFVDRYENVALSGFHGEWFAKHRDKLPPFMLNRRIYSCILIKNDLPYRWRGRYNEDTDLSLRVLKDGWCTVLFYTFLAKKPETMTMAGGNTDELYQDDGRLKMAESLCAQHPDVATVAWKFGRWQHHVDYSPFRSNKLKMRPDVLVKQGVNDYGMVLKEITIP